MKFKVHCIRRDNALPYHIIVDASTTDSARSAALTLGHLVGTAEAIEESQTPTPSSHDQRPGTVTAPPPASHDPRPRMVTAVTAAESHSATAPGHNTAPEGPAGTPPWVWYWAKVWAIVTGSILASMATIVVVGLVCIGLFWVIVCAGIGSATKTSNPRPTIKAR